MSQLSNSGKVGKAHKLSFLLVKKIYGAVYYDSIVFDSKSLGIQRSSWLWMMLQSLEAESAAVGPLKKSLRNMYAVIALLVKNPEAKKLLERSAERTKAAHMRRLFQLSEEIVAGADTRQLAVGRRDLRGFIFDRARTICFAEPIDPRRVRFKPSLLVAKNNPRPLISDFHDITDHRSSLPIGALAATTAKQISVAVKERAEYDLDRIRSACIADMTAAAALRKRAKELREMPVSLHHLSHIRKLMHDSRSAGPVLTRINATADIVLKGILKIIHEEELATSRAGISKYNIPKVDEVRAIFLNGVAQFKSLRLFEIEYRACVEEIFAAFHLLQTHLGWNWDSMIRLQADEIDLSTTGIVVLQSFKPKTDDNTPASSIDLSLPGVHIAIETLIWNREQLISAGFLSNLEQGLWVTRPRPSVNQRPGYFSAAGRLAEFIRRHELPKYSIEQVRNQVLFSASLTGGGIEAARLKGGHQSYGTTQRYVGNIVQDRISSSLNLEFSKRLEREIRYLYENDTRSGPHITLLKPIGDGSTCLNPGAPPPGRSRTRGSCVAESCHVQGGCPNRRIVIDDLRIEEVLRLNFHYEHNWQRLMQGNPDRFAVHTLHQIAFNAALLLALQRGPYAARVMHLREKIGLS